MDRFLGVGISVPGIIDAQGRMIQDSHALGVRKMPCDELSKGIEYPCVFMNDATRLGSRSCGKAPTWKTRYICP